MSFTAAVITVSDRGACGERRDTSGPAVCAMLENKGWRVVYTTIVPDEKKQIQTELVRCTDNLMVNLILTTGGTGFSPRDVTPEATIELLEKRTPGITEAMRAASLCITPRGCLSRAEAGIRGHSLIINLPGSEKAAKENLEAVLDPVAHGIEMLSGNGSADCGERSPYKQKLPSVDEWLREAKVDPSAGKVGMYLTHNGVVRATAKAQVRNGDGNASPVIGMSFSCNRGKAEAAAAEAKDMDGIYYVRLWLNEGELKVGDDLMLVLIGGDTRPHVENALQTLVDKIKKECVTEQEIYSGETNENN